MSANLNSYTNEFKKQTVEEAKRKIWHSFADKTNWSSEWFEWSERNSRGTFIKPKLSETVKWVKNAWDKVTVTTVENSLIAAYLYEIATFEETYIVKNTEYGHEIMKRIFEESSDFENETGTDKIDGLFSPK